MKNNTNTLAYIIPRFFRVYLPGERGYSSATIASYRDTFKQFLPYCEKLLGKASEKIEIADISKNIVMSFLSHIENSGKSISTRNQRLAAIKSFFFYVKYDYPDYLDIATNILKIKMKKQTETIINYMSVEGISAVLQQPEIHTKSGYRDALLLSLLYDSAARVTEITTISVGDIRVDAPATILLHGKGRRDRLVPLSQQTANLIKTYLEQEKLTQPYMRDKPLFTNHTGNPLTRAGIAYILKKYVLLAKKEYPNLIPTHFSPHCMRHSKAMHLVQAGVAVIYIRDFLGHSSIKTTEIYAKADGKSKREALEAAYADVLSEEQKNITLWNEDESLMKFLNGLCKK